MEEFSFNIKAKYPPGGVYKPKTPAPKLVPLNVQSAASEVEVTAGFEGRFQDIVLKYKLPSVSSDKLVRAWNSNHMQIFQNQVNFAIWCATAGYRMTMKDYLSVAEPLIQAVFKFHLYFQIRAEIQAPLPSDTAFSVFKNSYSHGDFEKICSEFGVSLDTNWRKNSLRMMV